GDLSDLVAGIACKCQVAANGVGDLCEVTTSVVCEGNCISIFVLNGGELPRRGEGEAGLVLLGQCECAVNVLDERAEDAGLRRVGRAVQRERFAVAVAPFDGGCSC